MHKDALENPVFILGLHRSGTTLLYEMLASLDHWNALCAWHVAGYDQLRTRRGDPASCRTDFARRLRAAGLRTRGVDAVPVSPDTKEEYYFILDNLSLGRMLTQQAFPAFQEMCHIVQSTCPVPRPLLLKNPWDFGNAPTILRLIPSARFVTIHRHPLQAVNSMWKFLNHVIDSPNAYLASISQRYARVVRSRWKLPLLRRLVRTLPGTVIDALIQAFGRQADAWLSSIEQIPKARHAEVTYDNLCARPNATMASIHARFGLGVCHKDVSRMVAPRRASIDPLIADRADQIARRMARYIERTNAPDTARKSAA